MSRRRAREAALQALFQLDFNEMNHVHALDAVLEEQEKLSVPSRAYAQEIVEGTKAHLEEIDAILGEASAEWKVSRMPGVDRNIARLAVYELRFSAEALTPNIVINEAVELAKRFGTDASSRFINGVLGAVIKKQ